MQTQQISSSTKVLGKYEKDIIQNLSEHFSGNGYVAFPHSRLNIAWGTILSDIDLLLLKDDLVTYIEVKSHKDKFARAFQQIERVKDYIDYAYIATDRMIDDWKTSDIGLIHVRNNAVSVKNLPTRFTDSPRFLSILNLKMKCLIRFLGNGKPCRTYASKYNLAKYVYIVRSSECTRECLKEITTCGELCDGFCPIENFVKKD